MRLTPQHLWNRIAVSDVDDPILGSGISDGCWLKVVNNYPWVGDPRLGKFKVFLDGRAAGLAPVAGFLKVPMESGHHSVQVRFRWYGSPRVEFDVESGETVRLGADIGRDLPVLQWMARTALRPSRSLSLSLLQTPRVDPTASRSLDRSAPNGKSDPGSWTSVAMQRMRVAWLVQGLMAILGFFVVLVGVRVGVALTIVGVVLVCVSAVLGIRTAAAYHRARRINAPRDSSTESRWHE